jgi:hypothetical protein
MQPWFIQPAIGVRMKEHKSPQVNPDPITGEPGSHPVGTGVGAAGGGAAGAAVGAVGGPVGAAVGGIIGAVAGGLAGKAAAEAVDPTVEDAYWRENYKKEPYHNPSLSYDDYAPAYRLGYEAYGDRRGRRFEDVEPELENRWSTAKGRSSLEWQRAKSAVRAGWHRVERAIPGDADGDGR